MGKLEKISASNLTKVRSKKEVIDEARTSGAKVHFASLMDIHFHRKYKQLFFLFWGGLIFLCSYSFWRRSNYFLSS